MIAESEGGLIMFGTGKMMEAMPENSFRLPNQIDKEILKHVEEEMDKNNHLWLEYEMGIELARLMNEGGCIFFCWSRKGRSRLSRIMAMFEKLRDTQGFKDKMEKEALW